MGKQKVTAIFDIGKTNKKFFLFDTNFQELHREYISFKEIKDEDGYPTEDLPELISWLQTTTKKILNSKEYKIDAINFTTYGASFIHLDENGNVLTPLYNYTKPIPESIIIEFYSTYGDKKKIALETSSPQNGALNSGLQLFWIKKTKPEIYKKIKYSLHFPQYLSYLFTGIPVSEYTSIGCHTNLWNFNSNSYHDWVFKEALTDNLPPIVTAKTTIEKIISNKRIKIGVGIHDSSSALLPYLLSKKKPFLLVSTGTWSISLNAFDNEYLTENDIKNNCLKYLKFDGRPVKATRVFLGNEYRIQVENLCKFYNKKYGYHRTVKFDKNIFCKLEKNQGIYFRFNGISINRKQINSTHLNSFNTFEVAYHQLMIELMQLQVQSIKMTLGSNTHIKQIYIDGGFTNNDVFLKLLAYYFKDYKIKATNASLGTALGAAMIISTKKITSKFLKENYKVKKLIPPILKLQQ